MLKYVQELHPALETRKTLGLDSSPKSGTPTLKTLKSIKPDLRQPRLPKEKLKKKDIANESFEVEQENVAMNKKFKQERLVLGMQLQPISFANLGRNKGEFSVAQGNEWDQQRAGCDIPLSENMTKVCMDEVLAYRQNSFVVNQEKRTSIEKELVANAYMLRLAAQKGEIQKPTSQSRNKKRRTVDCFHVEFEYWHSKYGKIRRNRE